MNQQVYKQPLGNTQAAQDQRHSATTAETQRSNGKTQYTCTLRRHTHAHHSICTYRTRQQKVSGCMEDLKISKVRNQSIILSAVQQLISHQTLLYWFILLAFGCSWQLCLEKSK